MKDRVVVTENPFGMSTEKSVGASITWHIFWPAGLISYTGMAGDGRHQAFDTLCTHEKKKLDSTILSSMPDIRKATTPSPTLLHCKQWGAG